MKNLFYTRKTIIICLMSSVFGLLASNCMGDSEEQMIYTDEGYTDFYFIGNSTAKSDQFSSDLISNSDTLIIREAGTYQIYNSGRTNILTGRRYVAYRSKTWGKTIGDIVVPFSLEDTTFVSRGNIIVPVTNIFKDKNGNDSIVTSKLSCPIDISGHFYCGIYEKVSNATIKISNLNGTTEISLNPTFSYSKYTSGANTKPINM